MRKTGLLLGLSLLAGCHADPTRSSFDAVDGTGFHYVAVGTAVHPARSESAEAYRMLVLEGYLKEYHLCPDGYKITSRTTGGINESLVRIVYDGTCT